MLNKTFLLGCAIAFLTACGGSNLNLGPNNPDYGKPIPDPEVIVPVELDWDFNFNDAAQATLWEDRSGGNMSADFFIHGQQTVLGVNAHDWTSGANVNDDNLAVVGMFADGPRDVRGGVVYMSIFLPAFYTDQNPWNNADDDGPEDDPYNFGFNVTAEDINGNEINVTNWKNVYEFLGSSFSTLSGLGYSQRTPDPAVGDVAGRWFDLIFNAPTQVDDGFDATQVVGIGFSLARDGINVDLPALPKEDEYIYLDNILVQVDGDYVPPVILDPAKELVDFVLPVYLDGVESGFSNGWGGWGGEWSWNDSLAANYAGDGGLQIGGPGDLDVSGYTNFYISVYGEDGSGTSSLDIALCDCDGNYITVEVEGGEWTDLVIPVSDFTDISIAAIRILYRGPDARTFFFDNIGFDLIEGGPGGEQPLSRGWAVEGNDGLGLSYGAVSYTVLATDNQLNYVLAGPVDLTGATASFTIDVDQAYIDSGASIQPYAQAMFGDWVGQWDCNLGNADLKVGGVKIDCLLSEDFNIPEGENVKLALLAKGDTPAGMVAVTGLSVAMPEGVAAPVISLGKGWAVEGDDVGELVYKDQVSYSPVLNDAQLNLVIDGPVDMSGATILFDIAVSQAFIDSGANIQPYAQAMFGDWPGQWDCNIANADLTTTSTQYSCALAVDTFNIPNGERIKVAMLVKGDAPAGTVTVTRTEIILAVELLPLTQGWAVEGNDDVGLAYGAVSYTVLANDNQLNYVINGPIDLTGATVTFGLAVDQAYIDSGAAIQPYAQAMFGDWVGQWDCNVGNADLKLGGMQYSCILSEDFNIPEGEGVKLALLAKGDTAAGVITVTGMSVSMAGGATAPAISLTKGWAVEGEDVGDASYSERVTYTPLLNDAQLNFVVDGPIDLTNSTVVFNIAASQAFIDSGAAIQPYAQAMFGDWVGQWDCNIDNAVLVTTGAEYECALTEDFNIPEGERVKISMLVKGDTPAGSVTVLGVKYVLPLSE